MLKFYIIYFISLSFIICQLILPFKTYNPLITKNNDVIELIKKSSDEEIVKTLLHNLIYVKIEIGKINAKNGNNQKIDFFIDMNQNEFYFNILDNPNFNKTKIMYPDLQYNNYVLLKNILNFSYYNISLSKSSFYSIHNLEKDIANETINLSFKNNIYEKEERKEIRIYIPYKKSILYDHRPGVIGLSFGSYFILNLKYKIPIKLDNWIIKYNDYFNEEGELIIGNLPHEYDNQKYKKENLKMSKIYFEENMHPDWHLKFIKSFIILNNGNSFIEYQLKENTIASFRIEEFFILGSDEYYHKIINLFFNDYINKNICQKQMHKKTKYGKNHYHIICYFEGDKKKLNTFLNTFPTLKFFQKEMNYNFTLNATDLFTIIPDNNRVLFNIEFLENYNYWVFGKPFFKKYPLIFNDEEKMIKYYIEKDKENTDKLYNNFYINSIKVVIICLLIFSFYIFSLFINKNVKKYKIENKTFELNEYFHYSNNEL